MAATDTSIRWSLHGKALRTVRSGSSSSFFFLPPQTEKWSQNVFWAPCSDSGSHHRRCGISSTSNRCTAPRSISPPSASAALFMSPTSPRSSVLDADVASARRADEPIFFIPCIYRTSQANHNPPVGAIITPRSLTTTKPPLHLFARTFSLNSQTYYQATDSYTDTSLLPRSPWGLSRPSGVRTQMLSTFRLLSYSRLLACRLILGTYTN